MAVKDLQVTVENPHANVRLDQFLVEQFPQVSRAYLQKQIEKKKILVNGAPTRKGTLLKAGDVVEVQEVLAVKERRLAGNAALNIPIVYEDADLCVIDKPPGIPSHPVQYEETNTVANWWVSKYPEVLEEALNDGDPLRPGIVHRLDTDTSGLLILARTQNVLLQMQDQFRERSVFKQYEALVWGMPLKKEGRIDFAIAHDPRSKRRMIVIKNKNDVERYKAKASLSFYKVKKFYEKSQIAHVTVETKSGRMHQVRVHMEGIGHPLVGDDVYKPKKVSPDLLKKVHPARQMLHAARLEFSHPNTQERIQLSSKLPADFQSVIEEIESDISKPAV